MRRRLFSVARLVEMAELVDGDEIEGVDQPVRDGVARVVRVEEEATILDDRAVRGRAPEVAVARLAGVVVAGGVDVRQELGDGALDVIGAAEGTDDPALGRRVLGLLGALALLALLFGEGEVIPVPPVAEGLVELGKLAAGLMRSPRL